MINKDIKLTLDDVNIVPAVITGVNSRTECDPTYRNKLPIFISPMSCITDEYFASKYENYDLTPIVPTTVGIISRLSLTKKGKWCAYSLKEFEENFIKVEQQYKNTFKVCIDCANGHMEQLLYACQTAKHIYGNSIKIMTGNIACPETLHYYENYVDYVRLSIGSGGACTTAVNTGIYYPSASLIEECRTIKDSRDYKIKLIADGGLVTYGQMIKALALGADYIMLGSTILHCSDAGTSRVFDKNGRIIGNKYWGMSTEKAQRQRGFTDMKIEEGFNTVIPVDRTLGQFVREFASYLASTMSYCDKRTLKDFIGKVSLIRVTDTSYKQYSKNKPFNSHYEDN